MELSQPPLIRIYQSCQVLMDIKRQLFQALSLQSLPHSPYNEEKRTTSSRVYLYIKKLAKEIRNQVEELSSGSNHQSHIDLVSKVITDLKYWLVYLGIILNFFLKRKSWSCRPTKPLKIGMALKTPWFITSKMKERNSKRCWMLSYQKLIPSQWLANNPKNLSTCANYNDSWKTIYVLFQKMRESSMPINMLKL